MSNDNYYNPLTHESSTALSFNPHDYIRVESGGYALCSNPMADGGLSAITVNTGLAGEALRNFEASIKRMVLAKMFSPKFGEVILTATRMGNQHAA
jgi:hypothetical protein